MKNKSRKKTKVQVVQDFNDYCGFLWRYVRNRVYAPFSYFESAKDVVVGGLYKDRGKKARPILHAGAMATAFGVVMLGPTLFDRSAGGMQDAGGDVLAAASEEVSFYTMQAEEVRQMRGGEVMAHEVREGERLAALIFPAAPRATLMPDTARRALTTCITWSVCAASSSLPGSSFPRRW
jgi:hypothetical protein